eukprot:CAMPEP_0173068844 /NCGR_PEP_ID=MMETSP1102-20130122/7657_1 /TAXON_ID=49646 /ORGANISM="Geminigera sp., Strain Caron Lab Isolate" /LENGTH=348 /DNA_ID=CAMNT_0013936787 /DNA_START=138 /DNA_END=1184 /DNA_ORIENTATION=+
MADQAMVSLPGPIVGLDMAAKTGMMVRLTPGVDGFIDWVPEGMIGRVLRIQSKGEAVTVVWPFIRRERLCRTGARGCYELEFVGWGMAKDETTPPDTMRTHSTYSKQRRCASTASMSKHPMKIPFDKVVGVREAEQEESPFIGSVRETAPCLRVRQFGRFSRRMWGTSAHAFQDPILLPSWLRSESVPLESRGEHKLKSHEPRGLVVVGDIGGGRRVGRRTSVDDKTEALRQFKDDYLSLPDLRTSMSTMTTHPHTRAHAHTHTHASYPPVQINSPTGIEPSLQGSAWHEIDGVPVHARAGQETQILDARHVGAHTNKRQSGNRKNLASPSKNVRTLALPKGMTHSYV